MNIHSNIYKTIEAREIEQIIKKTYDKHTALESWREFGSGLFNTTYLVTTQHPAKSLVLRVAPVRQELLFEFEKVMMGIEPLLYKLFQEHGIPAPEVVVYDESQLIIPRNYIISEYIDSITLSDPSFPKDQMDSIMYDLGRYTAKIHAIKADKFGWPTADGDVHGSSVWWDVVQMFMREDAEKTSNHHVFAEKTIRQFTDFIERNRQLFVNREQPSLVHNDLWDANLLVRQAGPRWEIAAIIDADRAMYADREFEFALWGNNPHFDKGYGISLDMSAEGVLKRTAYQLIGAFFGAYVYKVQYNNETEYERTKEWVLNTLAEVAAQ